MSNLFDELDRRRPTAQKVMSARDAQLQHAQRVLDFLQRWNKDTVAERDLRNFGPHPRDRKSARASAGILVESGWLQPVQARQYNAQAWRIIRKPIVRPVL
jgi:hypothetical protein